MSNLAIYDEVTEVTEDTTDTGLVPVEDTLALLDDGSEQGDDGGSQRLGRVSFFSSYAKGNRPKVLTEAGVKLGQFYLQDAGGVIARSPFTIFITPARFTCYALFDNKGKVFAAKAKTQGGWQPDRAKGDKWKEHTISLVLVPLSDTAITAAFLDTSSAIERMWRPINDTLKLVGSADGWAARGPAYKEAAKAILPHGRFLSCISTYEEPGKNDPTSKNVIGQAQPIPTPASLVAAFNDYVQSRAFNDAVGIFMKRKAKLIELQNKQGSGK